VGTLLAVATSAVTTLTAASLATEILVGTLLTLEQMSTRR